MSTKIKQIILNFSYLYLTVKAKRWNLTKTWYLNKKTKNYKSGILDLPFWVISVGFSEIDRKSDYDY